MIRTHVTAVLLALVAGACLASAARADVIQGEVSYTLSSDGCSSGSCGTGPFGTVQLQQTEDGVKVTETLARNVAFVRTGAGKSLAFNIDKAVRISDPSDNFSVGSGSTSASTFGRFTNYVWCSGCGRGGSNPVLGSLEFTVSAQHGTLTLADFLANADNAYFASDIGIAKDGKVTATGNVAALGTTSTQAVTQTVSPSVPVIVTATSLAGTAVPEPAGLSLLASGVLGLLVLRRRRA